MNRLLGAAVEARKKQSFGGEPLWLRKGNPAAVQKANPEGQSQYSALSAGDSSRLIRPRNELRGFLWSIISLLRIFANKAHTYQPRKSLGTTAFLVRSIQARFRYEKSQNANLI
jgi:hypothetical protein